MVNKLFQCPVCFDGVDPELGPVGHIQACIDNLNDPTTEEGRGLDPEEKRGRWIHLSGHLEQLQRLPPPLREDSLELETRVVAFEELAEGLEVRQEGDDPPTLVGYASVFGKLSLPLGFGREKVQRGAWAASIANDDIRALWNHDSNIVLGRTKSGTLKLSEDKRGLKVEITPPDSFQFMETIKRGDVDGMSIRFTVQEQKFKNLDKEDETVRTILKGKLHEVSPVTFPAFPDTKVAVRSVQEWRSSYEAEELRGRSLAALLNRIINAAATDSRPRADIIAAMGRASNISASTVGQILNASIICPPIARLTGFADVLDVSLGRLIAAGNRDGCEYERSDKGCDCGVRLDALERRVRLGEIAASIRVR